MKRWWWIRTSESILILTGRSTQLTDARSGWSADACSEDLEPSSCVKHLTHPQHQPSHSVTLLLLLTPYLQSESAPAPLTAGHLLSIQLLIPGHRRPTAGLQPALKPGRPVLSSGLGGLPTSGSLCTAPTPPPPSPHSASTQPAPCCPKPPFLRRALPGQAFQSCLLSQILCFFIEEAAIHRVGILCKNKVGTYAVYLGS